MIEFIKSGFCTDKGELDDARLAAFMLVVAYITHSALSIYMSPTHSFDAQNWGMGAGALCAGIGALFGFRKEY